MHVIGAVTKIKEKLFYVNKSITVNKELFHFLLLLSVTNFKVKGKIRQVYCRFLKIKIKVTGGI